MEKGLSILNTRVFKTGEKEYKITIASIKETDSCTMEFRDCQLQICYGEFSPYFIEMNGYLEKALQYAANDN